MFNCSPTMRVVETVDVTLDGKVVGRACRREGGAITERIQWEIFGTDDDGPLGGRKSRVLFHTVGKTLASVVKKARAVAPRITAA